jgi:large subunit ribosomal protein L5
MEKLVERYNKNIIPELKKELSLSNIMEVPQLVKVVVSSGVGDFKEDNKAVEKISSELAKITGLKPKLNRSKKAVSAFKLRIGQPVGLTVTLRGEKMYDFLDRLVNVAFPRVRDFRGLPKKAFDGKGNYSIGIKDYSIFPEIKYEDVTTPFGFQVNIKTNCNNNKDAEALFKKLGFPFEKK